MDKSRKGTYAGKMYRKLIAMVLTLCLIAAPVSAFAADIDVQDQPQDAGTAVEEQIQADEDQESRATDEKAEAEDPSEVQPGAEAAEEPQSSSSEQEEPAVTPEKENAGKNAGKKAIKAKAVDKKTVRLTVQKGGEFLFVPKLSETVTSDLSDEYGFTGEDKEYTDGTAVSLLDILIRAHELAYGDSFTPETVSSYLETEISSSGKVVVSRMFEKEGNYYNFDFAVNGRLPGQEYPCGQNIDFYPINQIHPIDGDNVEFFVAQTGATDEYSWIEKGGKYVSDLTVKQNTETAVKVKGIKYFVQANRYGDADRMKEDGELLQHVSLATIDLTTGEITPIEGSTTDENGVAKINMTEKGKYYLVVIPDGTDDAPPVIMTLTELTVTDAPDPELKAPETITIIPDAKKIVKHSFTSSYGTTSEYEYFMCSEKNGSKLALKAVDQDGNETPVSWSGSSANYIKFNDSTEGVATVTNTSGYDSSVTVTATSMIDGCDVKGTYRFTVLPKLGARLGYSGDYNDSVDVSFEMDPETGRFGDVKPSSPSIAGGSAYISNGAAEIKVADESILSAAANYSSVSMTPHKPGKTTVTICDKYDDQNCTTINVEVKGVLVRSGDEVRNTNTFVGGTKQLTYDSQNATDEITWQSADESIATVDDNGLVTGVKTGSVKIYALLDGQKAGMINVGVLPSEDSVVIRGLVIKSPSDFYTAEDFDTSSRLTSTTGYDDDYAGPSGNLYSISGNWVDVYGDIDDTLYTKSSTTKMTFFPLFGKDVKVEAYLDGKEVADGESAKDMVVNLHPLENKIEIKVISASDPSLTKSYKFTVNRDRSDKATMDKMNISPEGRDLSGSLQFADQKEGTLFIMDDEWNYKKSYSSYSTVSSYSGIGNNDKIRGHLFNDVDEFTVDLVASDSEGAHIRYALDGDDTYKEGIGTLKTDKLSFKEGEDTVRLNVQCVSDKDYAASEAASEDPWQNANAKAYTLEVKQIPVSPEDLRFKSLEIVSDGCKLMTPVYSEQNPTLSAIVPVDVTDVDIKAVPNDKDATAYCATGTYSLYNDSNKLDAEEDGSFMINIKPTSSYGNDRYVAIAKDIDGMRASCVSNIKLEKVTETADTKGLPDQVSEFMNVGGTNTNKDDSYNPTGLYPEKTIKSTGALASKIGLGSFGGYVTYYYKDGIKNSPNNPYGIDFSVFARSVSDSNPAASSVFVSKDGKKWYELAGSEHYDRNAVWNYSVEYSNDNGTAAFKDSLGRSGSTGWAYPDEKSYPLYEGDMKFSGTLLLGANGLNYDSVDSSPMSYAWGYVGAHKASQIASGQKYAEHAGNPYVEDYDGYGDGYDISWAVDAKGEPVELDEINYVKVSSASMIKTSGADKGGQGRVAFMVANDADEDAVGVTPAPASIKVGDNNIAVSPDRKLYTAVVKSNAFDVSVEAADAENVYINDLRANERSYGDADEFDFDKGIIRVIVQSGSKEPSILYVRVEKENISVNDAVSKAEKAVGAAEKALADAKKAKEAADKAAKTPGSKALEAAQKAADAAALASSKVKAAEQAIKDARKAAEEAGVSSPVKKLDGLTDRLAPVKSETENIVNKTGAQLNKAKKAVKELKKKYTPKRVTIKSAKAKKGKKSFTVKWKTIKKGVTGYQIKVVSKKTGKTVKTVKMKQTKKLAKKKTIKRVFRKMKKGSYKVKIRAYKKVNGEIYYGKWSKTKTVKVRK